MAKKPLTNLYDMNSKLNRIIFCAALMRLYDGKKVNR